MSALKQITTRAKVIRRSQGGSWKSAIKKASAEYRNKSKKVSAVKFIEKKEKRSTRPSRIVKISRKKDGTFKNFKQVGAITNTIDWKSVRKQKLKFWQDKSGSFYTFGGKVITYIHSDKVDALRWLQKNYTLGFY